MSETSESALTEPLEGLLGYQLRRLSAVTMAHLAGALTQQNLSPVAATVLLVVETNPGETQARLGRALAIQRANIAPLVARLEADGLVKRNVSDGRSYGLACTPKGKAAAKRVRVIMANHEDAVFGALSQEDQKKLLDLLLKARRPLTSFNEG